MPRYNVSSTKDEKLLAHFSANTTINSPCSLRSSWNTSNSTGHSSRNCWASEALNCSCYNWCPCCHMQVVGASLHLAYGTESGSVITHKSARDPSLRSG